MKNLYYTVGLLIFLLSTTNGCSDDFLSVSPKGSLDQNTLTNEQGANGVLMAAYSLLNDEGAPGGNIFATRTVLSSMASDEAFVGTLGGSGGIAQFHFFRYDPSHENLNQRWEFLYAAVQRSNDVLRLLNKEEMEISEASGQRIRAEARFLRGLYHLQLKMLFGNIPYIDETVTYAEGNYRVSNEESAWPDIEADFQYAVDNLNDTAPNPGNANKWAAKSLLARTYMQQTKFAEAKPLLEDIIANGVTSSGQKYDLLDQYHWNFSSQHKNGPEAVFQVQMSVDPTASAGNMIERGNGPYGGSSTAYGWMQPTFDFADRFQTDENGLPLIETYDENPIKTDHGLESTEDFTPEQGPLDPRIDWSLGRRGIPYLDHGINPGRSWIRAWTLGGPYSSIKSSAWASRPEDKQGIVTNTPYNVIRFADVLLMAAEVEVEIGSLLQAETYVNRVRERAANPEGFVKEYIDPSDPTAGFSEEPAANYDIGLYNGHFAQNGQDWAREAVRFERVLELGLEHLRFFDLKRYDKVEEGYMADTMNDFLQGTLEIPLLDKSYFRSDDEFTQGKNEYYPIPLEQIDLSVDPETGEPTLIQNPGY